MVDDEEDIRNGLSTGLTAAGYEVTTAADGNEALAVINRQHADLVVLDAVMPEVDGFTVLKVIRQQFPTVRVVMLTAYDDLRHAMEKEHEADDFIGKPCNLEDLLATIKRLLDR